jgi:hypothetical protein
MVFSNNRTILWTPKTVSINFGRQGDTSLVQLALHTCALYDRPETAGGNDGMHHHESTANRHGEEQEETHFFGAWMRDNGFRGVTHQITFIGKHHHTYFFVMNHQPTGMNTNPGAPSGGVSYNPAPRQDMEYICAGMYAIGILTYFKSLYFRLWCKERDQGSRTHPLSRMRSQNHVQEKN